MASTVGEDVVVMRVLLTSIPLAFTEFKDLWHSIKVPDAVDLARSLEAGK